MAIVAGPDLKKILSPEAWEIIKDAHAVTITMKRGDCVAITIERPIDKTNPAEAELLDKMIIKAVSHRAVDVDEARGIVVCELCGRIGQRRIDGIAWLSEPYRESHYPHFCVARVPNRKPVKPAD